MMGCWTESVGIKGEDEDVHKTEPLQTQHDQIIVEKALLCLLCKLFF